MQQDEEAEKVKITVLWDRNWTIPPVLRQTLTALGPLILTISSGMTSGYSAILLPQLQEANSTITITQTEASWIASMAALPMSLGCILGGILMEKLGRKTAHLLTTIPLITGQLFLAFAGKIHWILLGRFLTGICTGLLGPCTGVYIAETSEPKFRGFLLAAISFSIAFGLFLVHLLGTYLPWDTVALYSITLPVVAALLMTFVPESPAWLLSKDRKSHAQRAFHWCRGASDEALREFAALNDAPKTSAETSDLLRSEFWKPLVIMVVFMVGNQWCGVNAITFYTVSILQQTLGNSLNEYLAMLTVDLIRVIFSVIACVLLRGFGRRPLALISGLGTFVSLLTLSLYAYFNVEIAWIPLVALIGYVSFISIGFVPLPWAMIGEVFPSKTRNIGSSITSFLGFAAFFSVVKTSPWMFDNLGSEGTFMLYASVALSCTVFVFVFLPETKNKTLGEIEESFKKATKAADPIKSDPLQDNLKTVPLQQGSFKTIIC